MYSEQEKNDIIEVICKLLGTSKVPELLTTNHWVELESGIWLLSGEQFGFFQKHLTEDLIKRLKVAGLYLGKMRKNFGLSIESLNFFKPNIARFVVVKGKTLQKYLYGKTVTIRVKKHKIADLEFNKVIVMSPENEAVGISSFKILEEIIENNEPIIVLKLEPISDLGLYIRNESSTFE